MDPLKPPDPAPGEGSLARRLRYLGVRGGESPRAAGGGARPRTGKAARRREARAPEALRGWERLGELTWRRRVHRENPLAGQELSELLLPPGYSAEDLLFFDTETTGLSGGAGSYVFLFGSARLAGEELICEQLFLGDFPGEPEFLRALAGRLEAHRLFLSYNGRAFDAPLLKTRFVLNRMPFDLGRQEDLLFWARRLWRRSLPDCSLGSVERGVLGIQRTQDVPGWEVPGIYLNYLANGADDRLSLVMEHNLQDVLSLARLYVHVNRLLRLEELPVDADGASLGSYLLRAGQGQGVPILHKSFSAGDQRAGRALSLHYKRQGQWPRAVALWEAMTQERSVFAAVELAKYHEHRLHDPRGALEWVRRIDSWDRPLSGEERAELAHRRRRLERKCPAESSGAEPAENSGAEPAESSGAEPAQGGAPETGPASGKGEFAARVEALRDLSARRLRREAPQNRK